MITYSRQDLMHWNYFVALEKELENVSRYIEFATDNESTYSIELAKILMSASSEIDVILKMICSVFGERWENIAGYRDCLRRHCPELADEEVFIPRFSMRFQPWINWKGNDDNSPDWWKSYNKVKHQRNESYREANLKNVINAVGALLVCTVFYYKLKGGLTFKDTTRQLIPKSNLYELKTDYYNAYLIAE